MYTLANTVSGKRQWDRCPTRFRMDHSKLTHEDYISREQPPTCEDTPLTIKRTLTERPSPSSIKRQFFGSNIKTVKHLLNNGDTTYFDPLLNVLCYKKKINHNKKLKSITNLS